MDLDSEEQSSERAELHFLAALVDELMRALLVEGVMDREKHRQQVELLKQQNRVVEERITYLKNMERKLKQIVVDWRRAEQQENKKELIKQLHALLFKQNQQM